MVALIFGIATLGLYDPATMLPGRLILFVLIGLLISFLVSLASAIPNIVAGLLGGTLNNPDRSKKDAYQEYPDSASK